MNVRLIRSSAFSISCLVMFLFGFMLISKTQLLPQLSQTLMGYDATLAGLTLGLGGMATVLLMPIAGFVTGRYIQPKWLIVAALAGTGWSLWSAAQLDLDVSFWNLAMVRVTQSCGCRSCSFR